MSYTNREDRVVVEPTGGNQIVEYHDRVRWGPIFAGIVTALASQLILSALGAAIGATNISGSGAPRTYADDVGRAVGIWSIISLFLSLLIGSWVAARASGPMNRNTAMLNGAILWATTLALSSWLLASGISGTFGILGANAGEIANQVQQGAVNVPNNPPNVTAQQARDIAGATAKAGWSFTIGSLLGLAASLIGSSIGARTPRHYT
ncbi:hypothetical protein [Coleofasciculus sp. FACHB-1120]|uniref:hypothetical protein n=1 Tax=Coleofasciculus sp. FACHB-1120 TaxID=2692783 RepID=UPI00168965FD|nr:hypothetical protein [Coleofasciculus sp. FACHB-1120]MBD2740984.1 hypothetical protein [Coleofasciculus sp. FACHB-1120]